MIRWAGSIDGSDGVGGYAPLAVASGPTASSVIQWLHGNHLGTPVLTTNASGTAVTPGTYAALGYPGQFKTHADLYYNRYRDYDPATGRYIQADPIGLAGDANPYAYARGNPFKYTDPDGLWANIAIGIAIGAGTELFSQLYQNGGRFECVDGWKVASSGLIGGLGGWVGGRLLTDGLRTLPNMTKGRIGEGLSVLENRLWGSRLLEANTRSILSQRTFVNSTWNSLFGTRYFVESKFGTSTLTSAQRAAARALGDTYRVERWGYDFFGRIGAYVGGAGATGANATVR